MSVNRVLIAAAFALLALGVYKSYADIVIPGLAAKAVTPAAKLFQTGIAALDANDLVKAEASFRESLKLDAKAAAPYMGLAQVAIRRGQASVAEDHMRTALSLAPNTASIQTSWGAYLYSQRELPEAEAALRKATSIDPQSVVAHVQLGDLYMAGFGKPAEAIKEYKAAIAAGPTHAGAHYALGLAYSSRNELTEAEGALTEATKLAPENPLTFHALGRVYAAKGQLDRALASFATAVKLSPNFAAPHIERGNVLAARGDDPGALKEYAAAQKKDPRRSVGAINVAMVHHRNQRWTEAEAAYKEVIRIEPANPVAYNNLAWILAERKERLDEALTLANKAVSLGPAVPDFHGTLGWVYRARGDMAKAEETLRKGVSLKPARAGVVFSLARVCMEQGKKAEAVAGFKRALSLEPNFAGAAEAKRYLKELGQG